MKISQLIKILEKNKEKYGDIQVEIYYKPIYAPYTLSSFTIYSEMLVVGTPKTNPVFRSEI